MANKGRKLTIKDLYIGQKLIHENGTVYTIKAIYHNDNSNLSALILMPESPAIVDISAWTYHRVANECSLAYPMYAHRYVYLFDGEIHITDNHMTERTAESFGFEPEDRIAKSAIELTF